MISVQPQKHMNCITRKPGHAAMKSQTQPGHTAMKRQTHNYNSQILSKIVDFLLSDVVYIKKSYTFQIV